MSRAGRTRLAEALLLAGDPEDAARTGVSLIHDRLGAKAMVDIVIPDARGRLRVNARSGLRLDGGRLRSSRRRSVLEQGEPALITLSQPHGWGLALIPLVAAGTSLGLVEAAAPIGVLRRAMTPLRRDAGVLAVALHGLKRRQEAERAVHDLQVALDGARRLLHARSTVEAVRAGADVCASRLDGPVVALALDRRTGGVAAHAMRRVPADRRAAVRRYLDDYADPTRLGRGDGELAEGIAAALGGTAMHLVVDGDVLVLVSASSRLSDARVADAAAGLLRESLHRLEALELAESRNRQLDLSIAWTAHELRSPLLATRSVLDHLLVHPDLVDRRLLELTRDEIGRAADLTEPLLRWMSGRARLRRRPVDLLSLVRETAEACDPSARERIRIEAPTAVWVRADPSQLRTALVNVLRNALAYSPQDEVVDVRVFVADGSARVVIEDRGPGVDDADRGAMFDPFTRGAAGSRGRSGSGLGLFIARRVLESHGGSVRLLPSRRGAAFCLQLPALSEGRQRSAS